MKFENIKVMNFVNALRGMRNPLESYHLNDTYYGFAPNVPEHIYEERTNGQDYKILSRDSHLDYDEPIVEFLSIGPNDMSLAKRLIKAGPEHRKFLRQIFVSVDITAPLYWWKEFDTYKVGTVANSTSTMHKITSKPITLDCFEIDDYNEQLELIDPINLCVRVDNFIDDLEQLRQKYLQTKDKKYWKELIRWLPESWLQTRTVTMSYENILTIVKQRENHKLNEWSGKDDNTKDNFVKFAETLPYAKEFIFELLYNDIS